MLSERTGLSLEALSKLPNLQGLIETLGAEGFNIWVKGQKQHVPGVKATAVVDPTGCGDAFRGALLYGLSNGWALDRCADLANQVGAIKIACAGPQNHVVPRVA